jgi:hypothetical protein
VFLVNLTMAELAALFAALSAGVVALYLLDRSRRRLTVATLRFWTAAEQPVETTRRRRIRQWPSLILQILGIACLLLAIAQLRWGEPDRSSRDHVLLLDTSAWMAARSPQGVLMDRARLAAIDYVRALPSSDRVMVVLADAVAMPVTAFESDRRKAELAIRSARPSTTALRLRAAVETASRALRLHAERAGEIVFAGAGRTGESEIAGWRPPANLRVLPVRAELENLGLKKISVRRSAAETDLWQVFVSARNYGARAREVDLTIAFGGAPSGARRLRLAPGGEQEANFEVRTKAAGWLEARLRHQDALPDDDRAVIELPAHRALKIALCSADPESWRPLLAAHPLAETMFLAVEACRAPEGAGIVLLDGFLPPSLPAAHLVLVEPPAEGSPIRVRSRVRDASLRSWRTDHPLGAGLHTRDLRLDEAEVFAPEPSDIAVAETQQGPVIVARGPSPARPFKTIAMGFHPMRSALRFELATPLLFANMVRWLTADSFRQTELHAASAGAVEVRLDEEIDAAAVRVADASGALPFTVRGRALRFHAGKPGAVEVTAGDRRMVYSLVLPELAESVWSPPAGVSAGIPGLVESVAAPRDLWYWLAIAGGALLAIEWLRYGRRDVVVRPARSRVVRLDLGWLRRRVRGPLRRAS